MGPTLEEQIREAWAAVAPDFEKLESEDGKYPVAWGRCVSLLESAFSSTLGRSVVAEHYVMPPDYDVFMKTIGGGWARETGPPDEVTLYEGSRIVELTRTNCGLHAEDRQQDTGLWINIGEPWSQSHEYLLCVDGRHRMFGSVVDAENTHPWMGLKALRILAPSFLDYLKVLGNA